MRTFYIFIAAILIALPVLFFWMANDRINEFTDTHNKIAENSTKHLSNAITRFVIERRRLVSEFAYVYQDTINELIKNPDNDEIIENINENLLRIFPHFIAFTLSDEHGNMLLDDFDGLVGELCQQDLTGFCERNIQLPRVHPNTDKYHFDIMIKMNEGKNVLFVSFNADLLGEIIKTTEIPGHEFMLTYPIDDRHLIEVTNQGSRQAITDRDDYRLTREEVSRFLFVRSVDETTWHMVDMHDKNWFSDYKQALYINLSIIYMTFVTVMAAMTLFIRREEKLKTEAERQRYEFIGVVSHELRTPLTSIKGSLGLVSGGVTGELPDKAKSMVDMALTNCDRLIELVNDLLDIQKIESGKISLDRKDINLTHLIKQAITDIEAYGSRFSVTYQLIDLLPDTTIYADEGRMLQVMNNLLSNAAKYGKEHDVVDISIIPYNRKVRMSISDNGKGISVELQNNIFDKFSQGDDSNSKKVKSTGLGLHIVKQIVNLHDGEIDFFTSENGTTFYVDLPIKQAAKK